MKPILVALSLALGVASLSYVRLHQNECRTEIYLGKAAPPIAQYVFVGFNKGAPSGTTPAYSSNCSGSSTAVTSGMCTIWGVAPSAGNAAYFVVYTGNGISVSKVCDGTGADGCTGATSTYYGSGGVAGTFASYCNGTSYCSTVFYTCNWNASNVSGDVTLTFSGSTTYYLAGISATGNTTTTNGCSDGYNKAQLGSGTTATSGTVTTTNSHDLMVGLFSNACGLTSYTAGSDGAGNTYTNRVNDTQVVMIETLGETATGTYSAAATQNPTCAWNAEVLATK